MEEQRYTPQEHLLYGSILVGSLMAMGLAAPVVFVGAYKIFGLYGTYVLWVISQLQGGS
mgnify:CR=1 FL=1